LRLLRDFLFRLGSRSGLLGSFEVVQIFSIDKLLSSKVKHFLSHPLKLHIPLDDLFETSIQTFAGEGGLVLGLAEILDHREDAVKHLIVLALDVGHEVLDFLVIGADEHELIGLLHVVVEFLGELGMGEQHVVDLEEAVVLILALLIATQELDDVLVGLHVLAFQPLQPPLRLL